jgi:hypothetical protein
VRKGARWCSSKSLSPLKISGAPGVLGPEILGSWLGRQADIVAVSLLGVVCDWQSVGGALLYS